MFTLILYALRCHLQVFEVHIINACTYCHSNYVNLHGEGLEVLKKFAFNHMWEYFMFAFIWRRYDKV